MDFLLVMTVIFGVGEPKVDIPVGLTTEGYCTVLGQMVAQDVFATTTAIDVSFTCTKQGDA